MIEQAHKGKTLCWSPVSWWYRTANRRLMVRLAWLAVLVVFSYSLDWMFLRKLLRDGSAIILESLGHQITSLDAGPAVLLRVDSGLYSITADCTYVKLFFMIVPFLWRFGLPLSTNLRRLTLLAIAVWLVNLARIILALNFDVRGFTWTMAHTVPTTLIHLTSLMVFVLLALRSDCDRGER